MIAGFPPFVGCNKYETLQFIFDKEWEVRFNDKIFGNITSTTIELIKKMLCKDWKEWITINEIWNKLNLNNRVINYKDALIVLDKIQKIKFSRNL